MLCVNGTRPTLVDALSQAYTRDVKTTTWSPDGQQAFPIVDHIVAAEVVSPGRTNAAGEKPVRPLDYARVWALRAFFSHHQFEEGIAHYQAAHPDLCRQQPTLPADYANLYTAVLQNVRQ
jgi:hypothetical protein